MGEKEVFNLVDKYITKLKQYFILRQVILYGSYAKNKANENSDIDLAVVVDRDSNHPDYLKASALLYKLLRGIDYRIEPKLFYYDEISNPEDNSFIADIQSHGKVLFKN